MAKTLNFHETHIPLEDVCSELGVSRRTGYRWKTRDGLEITRVGQRDYVEIATMQKFIKSKLRMAGPSGRAPRK